MNKAVNPILAGFYPDPSICAVGEDFYIVNSSFSYFPGLPIMHSKDLAHWEQIGNVLTRESQLPLGTEEISRGLFAPTIRYYKGTFYVICTNVTKGGNFVVTSKNPEGPYSEPHYLEGADGIDPSLFFDEDGKCYYIGTHPNPDGCKYDGDWYIYIQELDIVNFKLIGEPKNVWNGAMKGVHWPEGPHLYKIGEYYYILHAEGGTGPDHAISVARSENVFGPYENNFKNPIFTHRHLGKECPIKYVGHGDLVKTKNDEWYIVCLGVRPTHGYTTMGRETFLAKVDFEDNWPVVNCGVGILTDTVDVNLDVFRPESEKNPVPNTTKNYDFDKMEELTSDFLQIRNPVKDSYKLTKEGLLLKFGKDELTDTKHPTFLGIRQDTKNFRFRSKLDVSNLNNGKRAGICIYQNSKFQLRFEATNKEVNIILVTEGQETEIDTYPIWGNIVSLCFIVSDLTASAMVKTEQGTKIIKENIGLSSLSTEVAGGFVGCTLGLYAIDTDAKEDEYALFKYLSYERD